MSARTSRSGLLPSSMVCGDDVDISSILRQNGPKRHSIGSYSNVSEEKFLTPSSGATPTPFNRQPLSAIPRGLANGERSSDSEDSRSGSGATSGKEASPGYEESSGSEQSSGPANTDEGKSEDANVEDTNGSLSRVSIPRSKTSPALNGGWGIDDALKPLSQFTPDAAVGNGDVRINNGFSRMRAAHEVNMSKLAYLEALFQRAKLEEMRLKGFSSKPKSEEKLIDESAKASSPDSGYKSFPPQTNPTLKSSVSGPSLSTIAQSPGDVSLPDGQALLRTIENRLHQARSQETNDGRKNFYQTGGSCSAGSLSVLMNQQGLPNQVGTSNSVRYPSPSRPIDIVTGPVGAISPSSVPPGNQLKRPDGLGTRLTLGQGMPKSLPHNYRSRSAYSSPAVSPQRGPDPGMLISPSIAASVNKRFSSLENRGREERRGPSRNLPLRHTAHGFPSSILPISPPSPAQGAQALQRKMLLFLEIMETQAKFSKDLQSEIESHKDVLASLNATGQKLLGTLENQDEALLLHRRLGEMNHRWNTLKYKSIAIRNRLEGTAENWNSLLLSLRELIEWVIRKDTELSGLGPIVGDLQILGKYENDLTLFRRGLDEKQPVIESNLKSGRQLIASEPPLSDTSDSEAGRELDGDARYRGEESTRDLTRSVRREVTKLSEKWAALWERAANLAAQVSLANKKLGVLVKTVEEVGSRLEESEKVVNTWSSFPQDQNLADQYVHNIRKFRETLPDLQRGVDDVNDQAARFSAHNVPLSPANAAALHDLNSRWKNLETTVNDRWRQIAGRSREVTPLTPAQLASSVNPPWERATATNKVPYYINHAQETTHWDHPQMMDLLDSLSEFNHIKFSAYRTATKLRSLQKKLSLDRAKLQMVTDVFDEHGLRGQNDRLIDVNDMIVVLSTLYGRISSDHNDVNTTIATDLCLNWLLNVYDSQRTGQMRVLSFRVGLICLCRGHLEEKYRYMFRLIADPNRLVDQRKLGLLLHDCVQVPRQLGEVAAFGGSNIEPSVRSCFTKAGKDREAIEAVHFLTWVQQEPQSLVWLAVLHRVAASESIQHQVKCNICKTYPIVGLRYRCLKCLSFDMCQRCFFEGRSSKSHKITHPMHEYCTATTAGDEMKDFTKALKNKFKSKRSLQKHTKKGYLPVQTVLEGDPLESPSPSPSHNVSSQDMHSRLELYASRLAEVELRTNSNSTPDSEDEHGLIAQYCQSLSSTDAPFPVPKSPLQIMASVDADQKDELEQMIKDLEEENRALQAEYERLKSEQPTGSLIEDGMGQRSEAEMLAEAKLLREHKGRLEARMSILEDHNRQLEAQLQRLRQLLVEQQSGMGSPNKSSTLQTKSVTASQLAMDSPAKINGHSNQGGPGSAYEGLDQMSEYVRPPPPPVGTIAHMGNLFSRAGDPERAAGSPVVMSREKANDSHNDVMSRERANDSQSDDDQSDENDYDNTVSPIQTKSD